MTAEDLLRFTPIYFTDEEMNVIWAFAQDEIDHDDFEEDPELRSVLERIVIKITPTQRQTICGDGVCKAHGIHNRA